MDVDGAITMLEEEDVPTCTLSFFILRDISPSHRHLDRSTPLAPASSPLLRYHGTRGTCRSRRAFLRYVEYEQAPYTDPRTGLRYHDKSVYDLIKNLVRSLSLAWLDRDDAPCRVPASQKTTSPPEASIPSSSSTGGSELPSSRRIWTCSRLYASTPVHEFVIDHIRHVPFHVLLPAPLSIAPRVDGRNKCLVHGLFSPRTFYVEHSQRGAGDGKNLVTRWACTLAPSSVKLDR